MTTKQFDAEFFLADCCRFINLLNDVDIRKQMCAKVLAPVVWPYEEIRNHWDQIILRSLTRRETDQVLYQEDTLGTILEADHILNGLPADDGLSTEGMLVFSGTVATKMGLIISDRFDFEMEDPVLKRSIRYEYVIRILPQYP